LSDFSSVIEHKFENLVNWEWSFVLLFFQVLSKAPDLIEAYQPKIFGLINHTQLLGTYDIQEIMKKGVIYASYCWSRTGYINRKQRGF
jgi:hypothetical protein